MIGIIEVFLCCCVLYYFLTKERTADMVDVISNRLQDVYGSIRNPNVLGQGQIEERPTIAALQRFGQQLRRKREETKESDKVLRERNLYNLKEFPSLYIEPHTKPLRGLACRHCAPSDSEQQLDPRERRRDVKDILRITQHAGRQPYSSNLDWGVWCPHLAQCVRLTKFPYPQVSGQVLNDDRMLKAIDQATIDTINEKKEEFDPKDYEKLYHEIKRKHEKRAKNVLIDMRSKISDLLLRITSWVLYKLLPCFLSGVAAHPAQIDMLKAATIKAPNAPLIFLPLHRSHLDYILISFILLNNDIRSPIVAAGNNLRIPFFGALLRGLGAFFIKRKIDPIIGKKDIIYRALLHTYLQKCLASHHNVEFFIEGGRTRTGKPCMPKNGILSVIVDAFMDGTIEDALLVPVSVNYERLVDGNFIYEQLGQSKKPETFTSAMSAIWKTLRSRYGLMRIDFNEPFSIRELVKSFQKSASPIETKEKSFRKLQHNPSTTSLYGTDVVQEEHRTLVDSISRHVIYDCASATAVMTTNAVAFLLLNRFRDGVTLNVFVEALDELRQILEADRDIGFTGDSIDIINYAVELLGSEMVIKEKRGDKIFIKPLINIPNVIELSYYSNSLLPHFALESIVLTAIHKTLKQEEVKNPNLSIEKLGIDKEEVLRKCYNHCEAMRNEFIFCKPCQNMEQVLESTFERLSEKHLISVPQSSGDADAELVRMAKRITFELNDDDFDEEAERMRNRELIYLTTEGHCDRLVLMTVLAPIGHTYLSVALCLNNLLGNCILESEFIKICIKEITGRVRSGECKFGESISVDSIKNCVKLLEKWSVIEISSTTGMRLVTLTNSYNSSYGVDSVIQKLENIVPFL